MQYYLVCLKGVNDYDQSTDKQRNIYSIGLIETKEEATKEEEKK